MSVKKVAVIGLGDISGIYLKNIARVFQNIELYGVCTHRVERAREAAAEYGASRVYETMEQAFADPEVDIVVNLTRPMEHFDVTMKALQAGKQMCIRDSMNDLGISVLKGFQHEKRLHRLGHVRLKKV